MLLAMVLSGLFSLFFLNREIVIKLTNKITNRTSIVRYGPILKIFFNKIVKVTDPAITNKGR